MILGKVRCGFFQEQILLLQLAGAPPQLRQLRSLRNSQRRLLAGMLPTIGVNPITKSALDDAEFLSDLGDRTRRLDHQLHRLFPELRRVFFFDRTNSIPFQTSPSLVGSLSGRFRAPQLRLQVSFVLAVVRTRMVRPLSARTVRASEESRFS